MIEKAEGAAVRIEYMTKAVNQGNPTEAAVAVDMGVEAGKAGVGARRIVDLVKVGVQVNLRKNV